MDAVITGLGALTMFTEDLDSSTTFYRDVLGLPVAFQDDSCTVLKLGDTLINVLRADAAHELIDPAPVAPPGSGVRMQLTAWVSDVDAVCSLLQDRGVVLLNGPLDRPWGKRTAAFTDPSGNMWEVAEDLPGGAVD